MTIEQTVEIPSDYRLYLELPRTVPTGVMAKVEINIPTVWEASRNSVPAKSFRGILKGRGITLERFKEMQREDKALEDGADEHRNKGTQGL
jgi:hypothetical protein